MLRGVRSDTIELYYDSPHSEVQSAGKSPYGYSYTHDTKNIYLTILRLPTYAFFYKVTKCTNYVPKKIFGIKHCR